MNRSSVREGPSLAAERPTRSDDLIADRRPSRLRAAALARRCAVILIDAGLRADQVSMLGFLFAATAGLALIAAPGRPLLYLFAGGCIEMRLLCNLLDGLVAIEGGRRSAYGPLFNELPDQIEDSVILICLGCAAGWTWCGLLAALMAAAPGNVRLLGGSLGLRQDFCGPMAKPQRMGAAALGCLGAFGEAVVSGRHFALRAALVVICLGAGATAVRRTLRIGRELCAGT